MSWICSRQPTYFMVTCSQLDDFPSQPFAQLIFYARLSCQRNQLNIVGILNSVDPKIRPYPDGKSGSDANWELGTIAERQEDAGGKSPGTQGATFIEA
jgi:hypothetical protein